MHDQEFAHAAAPASAVCLHLPLKHYSIGHEIELRRTNNPLLNGTRDEFDALPKPERQKWLMLAADFCSQNHAEFIENNRILGSKPRFWQRSQRKIKRQLESGLSLFTSPCLLRGPWAGI